ncbi:MAG: hypothetical protein GXO15_03325 [Crenarchaeota archaeon]|nr:hypothetical protein [Thermoproteota archaeon]
MDPRTVEVACCGLELSKLIEKLSCIILEGGNPGVVEAARNLVLDIYALCTACGGDLLAYETRIPGGTMTLLLPRSCGPPREARASAGTVELETEQGCVLRFSCSTPG